ncbi:MAG: 30S ribosomal protein S18 [SAR324 cluster bacterium]|nr:30S ribosomal protein S18 [SAR324 cluster bacterium]
MGKRRRRKNSRRRNYTLAARKKFCSIETAKLDHIDHKDIQLLSLFTTEKGKIMPGRANSINARNQALISLAIKRARNLALLSFIQNYPAAEELASQQEKYAKKFVTKPTDSADDEKKDSSQSTEESSIKDSAVVEKKDSSKPSEESLVKIDASVEEKESLPSSEESLAKDDSEKENSSDKDDVKESTVEPIKEDL